MHTDLKERLHNWAPEPPEGGLERLLEALPHVEPPAYAQKLYAFAAPPPPAVWDAVAGELHPQQPATGVIQMYPRKRWLQVASIAASLLFAVYFLPPLFKSGKPAPASPPASAVQQSIVTLPVPETTPPVPQPGEEQLAVTVSAPKDVAANFSQLPLPPKESDPMPIAETERASSVLRSWLPENEGMHQVGNRMDRYIVLAVADDAAVRLPKKLYSAFRCEELPDPAGCLERLATLRRRLASPEQLASADFLGVMEVVRNMASGQ